jgi:hypothetical protein
MITEVGEQDDNPTKGLGLTYKKCQ